jgi:hypothetical protein
MGSDLFFENLNDLPSPKLKYSFFSLANLAGLLFSFSFRPKGLKMCAFLLGSVNSDFFFLGKNLQISLVNSSMKFELFYFHIWFIARFG